jgi:hypothetical protein
MPTAVWTAIIGAIGGFASASAVTAWANWGIEKRRLKRQRQYALVDSWRAGIAPTQSDDHTEIIRTTWYETLRPYLSEGHRFGLDRVVDSEGSSTAVPVAFVVVHEGLAAAR